MLGISRVSIANKRLGYNLFKEVNGKTKTYFYAPVLKKDVDYIWHDGRLVYFENAIQKIKGKKK